MITRARGGASRCGVADERWSPAAASWGRQCSWWLAPAGRAMPSPADSAEPRGANHGPKEYGPALHRTQRRAVVRPGPHQWTHKAICARARAFRIFLSNQKSGSRVDVDFPLSKLTRAHLLLYAHISPPTDTNLWRCSVTSSIL